jgi:hypothetical protein
MNDREELRGNDKELKEKIKERGIVDAAESKPQLISEQKY